MQIFEVETVFVARNMNLVASRYLIGSTMFLVGSIPSLITLEDQLDRERIDDFLGCTFVAGSFFFFLGGVINFLRACKVLKHDLKKLQELQ